MGLAGVIADLGWIERCRVDVEPLTGANDIGDDESRIPAMPVTMVRKMTGAMIIRTSLMKPSPNGFNASPVAGQK